MRIARVSMGVLAIFCIALAPALAGQNGKGGSATHGNPRAQTATTSTSPGAHGRPRSATTTTAKAHASRRTTTATTGARTARARSRTTTSTTLNPIAQKLQGKPLGSRLEKMLPLHMTLNSASSEFRNQGQFVAAVHVSQNLGIPFADLKTAMLGTSTAAPTSAASASPMSLGQAIEHLKPFANATTETARAETQAAQDLKTIRASTTTTARTTRGSRSRRGA